MINSNFPLLELAINNIWQSMAVLAVIFVVFKMVRNTSAEERSWSWSAALFAVAILPLASFLPGEGIIFSKSKVVEVKNIEAPVMQENIMPSIKPELNELPLEVVTLPSYSMGDVFNIIMMIWAFGVGIALYKTGRAAFNASKIRSLAYPYVLDEAFTQDWPDEIEVALCDDVNGPLVIGFLKPVIILPRSFVKSMSIKELKPLLFHELAHIKRFDNFCHLFECLILAIYWWNPIVHFIAARLAEERELACDDRAAIKCGDQVLFAKSLLRGAKQLVGQNNTVLGIAALRRESVLSKRIKRMTGNLLFKEFEVMRFTKAITIFFICVALMGMLTPRFNMSFAQETDVIKRVETLLENGGTSSVLEEMSGIEDEQVAGYTKALLERKELRREEYKKLAGIVRDIENEKIEGSALEELLKRDDIDAETEKLVLATVLGKERISRIRADVQKGLEGLPTKEQVAEMEQNIRDAIENLPTEEMLAEMRKGIKEGLANLPEHIEKEINVDEIIAEAEAGFNEMEIEIDFDEIRADMEKSLAELPDKKEIDQMRENLERSLEGVMTFKDVEEMRREFQETLEQLPTGDET